MKEAIDRVLQAGRKHHVPAGFHSVPANVEEALMRQKQGFVFLGFSLDAIFLGDAVAKAMQELRDEN